jgi:carbamoyltransferase
MKILGIAAHFHDSSAALISDGELIAAAAEERFTRLKHDSNFPYYAIAFCLNRGGLTAQELDEIWFYEEPHVKFTRVLVSLLAGFPRSRKAFASAMKSWLGHKLWTKDEISKALNVHPDRVQFLPHHVSHAAQAFLGSGFQEAAVLTIDAVGEWTSTALCHASFGPPQLRIEQLECIPYPHSLGLVYAAFTAYLGFRPNDAECSTMALAAFGKPTYADKVRQLVRIQPDGTYWVDQSYFDFTSLEELPFTPKFISLFGEPRSFKRKLPFDALGGENPACRVDPEAQRYADVAASIQLVLEETVLALANRLNRLTGSKNLCFSGGVALNSVSNRTLLKQSSFENLFVPPDPGDGGASVGAALYGAFHRNGSFCRALVSPYLGQEYEETLDARMLAEIDPADWHEHMRPDCTGITRAQLQVKQLEVFNELVLQVANDLGEGRIVGWFQGRFEIGPRALGNRSILVDPRNLDSVRRMRQAVKSRAAFRPFALSVTEEDAFRVLELDGCIPRTARWMQTVVRVRDDVAGQLRGAIHIDQTTRVQVCAAADNPRFHQLLTEFGKRRRLAALLNTSFNEDGYPMIATPAEALLVFARTDMDTLVINNLLIRKLRT